MTPEEIVREALHYLPDSESSELFRGIDALDALVAERDALAARLAEAERAAMAAARLAELDAVSLFSTYECEHGSTVAQECADDEGPIRCWAHEDMRTLHDWLAARAALAAADRPDEMQERPS